jgi:uncharacterized protein (TIGR02996 family)
MPRWELLTATGVEVREAERWGRQVWTGEGMIAAGVIEPIRWDCALGDSDEEARELWHVVVDTLESNGFVAASAPRFAMPAPHDPHLSRAARHDVAAAQVYADWLLERGDGRGEWLAAEQDLTELEAVRLAARGRSRAERRLRERAKLSPALLSCRWQRGFLDELVLLDIDSLGAASLWSDPLVDGLRALRLAEMSSALPRDPIELPSIGEALVDLEELTVRCERVTLAPLNLPKLRRLALGGGAAVDGLRVATVSSLPALTHLDLVVGGVEDFAQVVGLVAQLAGLEQVRVDEPALAVHLRSLPRLHVEVR